MIHRCIRPSAQTTDCQFEIGRLTRRELLQGLLITGGAILSGCGRFNSSHSGTVITQWFHQYGEKGTQQAVIRYAAEYTRSHPHVSVQVVWVPGDYHTKLSTALLTNGGPDVFEDQLTTAMVTANQVAPLDDLFTPQTRADFLPADHAANSVGGKIYGIKTVDDCGVLYFRKSLMEAAGVAPPQTMDDLITASQKLTAGQRKGLFVGNDSGISALLNILPWSAGSDFLVDNKIVFNNERTVLAYQKLAELSSSGGLLDDAPTDWWDSASIINGLCVMQWTGLWAYPAIYKKFGDDLGGMAWPALDSAGSPSTFSGGWSIMVNSQSAHLDEAKQFVKWIAIDNVKDQLDWCLSYGFHVPPRISAAKSAVQLQSGVPAIAVTNLKKYGKFLPPSFNAAMNTVLTDAVTGVVKQGVPAATAMDDAARLCTRELERENE